MASKKKITMIGLSQAKVGKKFEYLGPVEECKDCHFFKVCHLNLEKGRVYQVVGVRRNTHPCPVHDEQVQTIEVEEPEIEILIDRSRALEGVTISYKLEPCYEFQCPLYELCQPVGIRNTDRLQVVEVLSPKLVDCKEKRNLKHVRVKRI
ncbi:MAG: UPF0179 family protein [Candidatus Ranarchaeia archaeon]